MPKYYVSNGTGDFKYGVILKGIGKSPTGKLLVVDEIEAPGKVVEASTQGIVEISEEDYKRVFNLNLELDKVDYVESYEVEAEINYILHKYIKPYFCYDLSKWLDH